KTLAGAASDPAAPLTDPSVRGRSRMEKQYMRSNIRLAIVAMEDPIKFARKMPPSEPTDAFELKVLGDRLENNQEEHAPLPLSSGVASWKSPSHANEDRYVEYRGSRFSLFAVIDGHGGDMASEYVKNNIVQVINEEPELNEATLWHATEELERRFTEIATEAKDFSGACFVALVIIEDRSHTRYVVNCGDCRISALERGGSKPSKREYKALSTDHKASCPMEKERIEKAGGVVVMDRVAGVLAPSRSIGDLDVKMPGMEGWVVADPEINKNKLCQDSIYVLATDGVWDVMSNRDVLCLAENTWLDNQVAHDGRVGCASACEAIAQEAVARGSRDDITCIVVRTGEWH
ncbi:unnamed protein product, partial [Aphanomyces euteiches]